MGLLAAVCWGTGDFLTSGVARRIGALQTFFSVQLIGTVTYGVLLLFITDVPDVPLVVWAQAAGISCFNMVGGLLLYRAFKVGTLALVAPVFSSYAIVTSLLALLSGERPSAIALVGVLLVVLGVSLVARVRHDEQAASLAGIPEALGVVVCFGTFFWAIELVTPALGVLWPVQVLHIVSILGPLGLLLARGERIILLPTGSGWRLFWISTLSTVAFIAYNVGISMANTAIVAPLSSLSSAVTVLLAWLLLRERLARWQWVGVGIILSGVVLVSM